MSEIHPSIAGLHRHFVRSHNNQNPPDRNKCPICDMYLSEYEAYSRAESLKSSSTDRAEIKTRLVISN